MTVKEKQDIRDDLSDFCAADEEFEDVLNCAHHFQLQDLMIKRIYLLKYKNNVSTKNSIIASSSCVNSNLILKSELNCKTFEKPSYNQDNNIQYYKKSKQHQSKQRNIVIDFIKLEKDLGLKRIQGKKSVRNNLNKDMFNIRGLMSNQSQRMNLNNFTEKCSKEQIQNKINNYDYHKHNCSPFMMRSRSTCRPRIKVPIKNEMTNQFSDPFINRKSSLLQKTLNDFSIAAMSNLPNNETPVNRQMLLSNFNGIKSLKSPYKISLINPKTIRKIKYKPPTTAATSNNIQNCSSNQSSKRSNEFYHKNWVRRYIIGERKQQPVKRMAKSVCKVFRNSNFTRN